MGKKNAKTVNTEVLLMKTMTKKQYKEHQKQQRSSVGQMMKTGTITMKSSKDFKRSENKVDLKKVDLY